MLIVVATKNPGKVREIGEALDAADVEWRTLDAFPPVADPEETGTTFLANAELKARAYVAHTGQPTLAEDSGLEVDALDGAPGVYSARYAGDACDDAANNATLLAHMATVPEGKRGAQYRSTFVLAFPDGRLTSATGTVRGTIAREGTGTHGFGYDPLFIPEGHTASFGVLDPSVKRAISHRAQALRALLPKLRHALQEVHPTP